MSLFAYPNQRYSSQLGLALFGQEEIIAENFLLIDAAYAAGSSISVNGTLVPSPNLSSTLPLAPLGEQLVTFQFDINGNISAYVPVPAPGGVTSFSGDSVVYNNALSVGAVTLSLIAQTANTIFAGPASAGPTAPTFRALVAADIPSLSGTYLPLAGGTLTGNLLFSLDNAHTIGAVGATRPSIIYAGTSVIAPLFNAATGFQIAGAAPSGHFLVGNGTNYVDATALPSGTVTWGQIGNAAAALTLANANYATTFNQTSAVAWLWANTTAATVATTNASPLLELAAQYWATGAVTGTDLWTIGIAALTAGLNSPSTLTFTHTGSTGSAAVRVPLLDIGGTDAGISRLAANNIGFGNGTAGDHTGTVYLSSCIAQSTSSGGCGEVAIQTGTSSHTGYVAWTDQSGNRTGYMGFDATSGTTADISLNISGGGSTSGAFNILSTVTRIGATDTGISRLGAASLAIGNGTAGNTTGNLSFNRVSLAGADYAGQATITAASTTKAVAFVANYTGTGQPVIVLTPTSDPLALGVPVGYWVTYSGSAGAWTGFTVNIQTALAGNVTFNYIVVGQA
jgi:hypothetical protein